MILLEDGTVILTKYGHIKCEFMINPHTEINLIKNHRFEIKTKDVYEMIDTPEAEVWVNILNSIRKLNYPCMDLMKKNSK